MTTLQKILVIGVGTLLAVGLVVIYLTQPSPQVLKETIREIGAMPGNELQGPEFIVNGVIHRYASKKASTATTTICALQAPSSTSTLVFSSISGTASSTGAVYLTMSQSATAFATTTLIGSEFLTTASAEHTIVGSTTVAAAGANEGVHIFAPNSWLVFGIEGTTVPTSNSPNMYCKAEWIVN